MDDSVPRSGNGRNMAEAAWPEYIERVRRYLATGRIDRDELSYKREVARELAVYARQCSPAAWTGWISWQRSPLTTSATCAAGGAATI